MNKTFAKIWQTLRNDSARTPDLAWLRVGMDSGGIAAGAERLFDRLITEVATAGPDLPVRPGGSHRFASPHPLGGGTPPGGRPKGWGGIVARWSRDAVIGGKAPPSAPCFLGRGAFRTGARAPPKQGQGGRRPGQGPARRPARHAGPATCADRGRQPAGGSDRRRPLRRAAALCAQPRAEPAGARGGIARTDQ